MFIAGICKEGFSVSWSSLDLEVVSGCAASDLLVTHPQGVILRHAEGNGSYKIPANG